MKPEVRIIDQQSEEIKPVDISQHEREMLLAKYGYTNQPQPQYQPDPSQELSFEEMCQREEQKRKEENAKKMQKMYGPKPISFDGDYNSDISYGSDPDSGLGFKITIVSDMPIPKKY